MFPIMPSSKIAQTVLFHRTKWPTELKIETNLKMTSHPKPLSQIQNTFTEMFNIMPSTRIAQTDLLN